MASVAIPQVQRAAVVTKYGGPAKFKEFLSLVTDKPVPTPGQGEVLVRMRARSVNPADGLAAMGLYPGFAPSSLLPATLGLEGMGHVAAAAADVTHLQVGQRVAPLFGFGYSKRGEGSWQEYVSLKAEHVLPLPDYVSDEVGAQVVINSATVFGLLRELAIPPGEYLLQTQAGGAVGRQMITLCKARGIRTINIVRRRETFDELKALGADEVLCSADEEVTQRVLEITNGRGAYGAVESVAGELTGKVVSAVRDGGTVLLLGGASSPVSKIGIQDIIFRGVQVRGFWATRFLTTTLEAVQKRTEFFQEIFDAISEGQLSPTVDRKFDLAEFALAMKAQQDVGRQGKILITG